MKLTLNLLSEDRKKEINNKRNFLIVIRQSLLFLMPIFCLGLILVSIDFALGISSQVQDNIFKVQQDQDNYKKLKEYEDDFSRVNLKVASLLRIQNGHLRWSKVFSNLSVIVPDNVYVSEIINKDYKISLAGKAKTRNDFLKFQDNLKNSECFSDINAPLSDLVAKEDVGFQIDFNVKADCLKNTNN